MSSENKVGISKLNKRKESQFLKSIFIWLMRLTSEHRDSNNFFLSKFLNESIVLVLRIAPDEG